MVKAKKTTQSAKRYTFQSFRERVDSIKIEPSKDIKTRAFDEVDDSHFLASLDRWVEFNRSGNFTQFALDIRNIAQGLPQIIYFKEKIFDILSEAILKQDVLSLQPLLELLTQLCHDLGSDFMVFYERSINMITKLALGENDSSTLEWEFNALAFIFKYLSKTLSQDLLPTFNLLEPLLKSKPHIARFCSEALSFLIRKTSSKELSTFTNFAFDRLKDDEQYQSSLIILFSEALKSTKGSIHSKSTIILGSLLEKIGTDESSSVLADILVDIIGHGNQDNVNDVYKLVLERIHIRLEVDSSFLNHYLKVLISLVFSDSGRKVKDWKSIIDAVLFMIKKFPGSELPVGSQSYAIYLLTLLVRNCEIQSLTRFYNTLFNYSASFGSLFLPFIISVTDISKEKSLKFSQSHIQSFINKNWQSNLEEIGLFIQHLNDKDLLTTTDDPLKFKIVLPKSLSEEIYRALDEINIEESKDLYEIYWRISFLVSASQVFNGDVLIQLFKKVKNHSSESKFKKSILSRIILLLVDNGNPGIHHLILQNFRYLSAELEFITSVTKYVKSNSIDDSVVFIQIVSNNLLSPDHDIKLGSLDLINSLATNLDEDIVTVSNQASIVEKLPLVISNGRDIGIRVRSFAAIVKNFETRDDLKSEIFFKFLFGLLAVRFMPAWDAVFEVLPTVYHKNENIIWELSHSFMNRDVEKTNMEFFNFVYDESDSHRPKWFIKDQRLESSISTISTIIDSYINKHTSLLSSVESKYGSKEYPEFIRTNAIKVLKSVPSIAEKNSNDFISLILETEEEEEEHKDRFNMKDQALIYEILSSFKKLERIPKAEQLKKKLLTLLSNKSPEIKKLALAALLNYHNKHINKYKDNLNNLLDDSTFRDELSKIVTRGTDSVVEDADLDEVMLIVLRILFGRAQTVTTSGNKKGLKTSSIQILASLDVKYVEQFLKISFERIYDDGDETMDFEVETDIINIGHLKRSLGFTNLLSDIITTLGEKFVDTLPFVIKPLLLIMAQAQAVIDSGSTLDEKKTSAAKMVRQSGGKDLLLLFQLLHDFSWDDYFETIYDKILSPRFPLFEFENLQQPSAILKILVCWSEYPSYYQLLLVNDLEPAHKVLDILSNENAKQEVISTILDFANNVINKIPGNKEFSRLQSFVADKVFTSLDQFLDLLTDNSIVTKAIDLLLALVERKHVKEQARRSKLVDLATKLIEKPSAQISKQSKLQLLQTLKALIHDFEGDFSGVEHLYEVCSKFLKLFTEKNQREDLVDVFVCLGEKFEEYIKVASLVEESNAFTNRGLSEPDYERRLSAYREINDELYCQFSILEWLPILNNSLFFINDLNDFSIRASASYSLRRFIDAFSQKETADRDFIRVFKNLILPNLRIGLRNKAEAVQTEFITLLCHIVTKSRHVDDFEDMKVLCYDGDEEANFFLNITHIQLHKRQRAIRELGDVCDRIKGSNIAHYLLPIIENYAYCSSEKLRNISNEAIANIERLINCVSYKQFLAVFKRYLAGLKEGSETQRDSVSLIVTVSKALLNSVQDTASSKMEGLPTEPTFLDRQIENEMLAPVAKILSARNEDTIIHRTPLIQAVASLALGLSHERILSILPGLLTKICQILRTRNDDLRDAVRKYLGRASNILGAKYIKFIIQELKTALGRGFQVHVLGFTVNSILLATDLKHGDLDLSASLIMDTIMENLFGAVAQEKEADGYRSNMKEVRHNKSLDTAELLARLISLSNFGDIINPIKLLLKERITFKIQKKLDELLRRLSLGIHKNDQLATQDMLVLCYELFQESERDLKPRASPLNARNNTNNEHFLVELDAKPLKVENGSSIYVDTFQRLSLELLRTSLSKNPELISGDRLAGFVPCFEKALRSENESVLICVLRILPGIVNVSFKTESDIFQLCAEKALNIIKDYPSTESELVQACFKYLATIIRLKEDLLLKESSLGYLLIRIQPDLNDSSRQGLAFNFLKTLISKHVMIPEIYDTMDKVREVMVTSHSKQRRDMSRSIYFQFIMEYDQGRGRLEKQFKFLVDNLSYPSEEGKQSVMELMHLIIGKSGPQLLEALSSSFFVGLAKVLISDTEPKTREMSIALITSIFKKMGSERYEKFIIGWMSSKNSALLKCSLQLYRIKLKVSGIEKGNLKPVDEDVLVNIKDTLQKSRSDSEIDVAWELLYTALNCLVVIADQSYELIDEDLKGYIISALLYPHSWIRLVSSRLVGLLISKEGALDDSDIQNISNRLLHQLRAPKIEESLGSQAVKFLTYAFMKWEKENSEFDQSLVQHVEDDPEEGDEEAGEFEAVKKAEKLTDWVLKKFGSILRSDKVSFFAKKSSIQFLGMCLQILDKSRVLELQEALIYPLFNLSQIESEATEKVELKDFSLECLKMIEDKLGVSDYTEAYNKVRAVVLKRRQERKTERARLAITAPEAAARKKMKKHAKTREKRKLERDANGFYHGKKKRTN